MLLPVFLTRLAGYLKKRVLPEQFYHDRERKILLPGSEMKSISEMTVRELIEELRYTYESAVLAIPDNWTASEWIAHIDSNMPLKCATIVRELYERQEAKVNRKIEDPGDAVLHLRSVDIDETSKIEKEESDV
jgi:hypothetical protein